MTNQEKVHSFMEKYGLLKDSRHLTPLFRARLMLEELSELVTAMQEYQASSSCDKTLIADAIGDLLYVVYGTAVVYGMDADRVMDRVHESNMTKDGLNQFGKQGKGPGFKPPDFTGLF